MTKILVTGSAGFIGYHLSKKLLEDGHEVVGLDNLNDFYDVKIKEDRNQILLQFPNYKFYRGDLADFEFVKKVFAENNFDKICHLAAQVNVRYSLENPILYINSNILGFTHLIEEAKNNNIKHFVYASSSSVYGDKTVPFREVNNTDTPVSLYAATKKSTELIAHAYHHSFGMNCTGLRFFTVYGPWGRPDMAYFKFAKAIAEGKEVDVYNFDKNRRDFTYIDDIVEGIAKALEKTFAYEILNLGNSQMVELRHFIAHLEKEMNSELKKNFLPAQTGDVVETFADIDRASELLDWRPKVSVEEGLKNFVEWYKEYYKI